MLIVGNYTKGTLLAKNLAANLTEITNHKPPYAASIAPQTAPLPISKNNITCSNIQPSEVNMPSALLSSKFFSTKTSQTKKEKQRKTCKASSQDQLGRATKIY